jgi:sulfatase maturation enzyme AslB (radical SAM superfamily)
LKLGVIIIAVFVLTGPRNLDMVELLGVKKSELPMLDEFKPIGKPNENSGLPLEFADTLADQIKEAGINSVVFTGGGESTLWKRYDDLVDNLIKNNIKIGLITNGSLMNPRRLGAIASNYSWVRFSMDSCTPQTHRKTHRTPNETFDSVIENIRKIVNLRKVTENKSEPEGLTIGVNYVIQEDNFHEISDLGVDYVRFSFMYIEGVGVGKFALDKKDETMKLFDNLTKKYNTDKFTVSPATYKLDSYIHENDDFDHCYMQDFVWALGANCLVYPCCIQKYEKGWEFGDIRKETLKQMVTRAYGNRRRLDVTTCPPCWMRDRNKSMISAIRRPKHAEFV